MDTVPFNRELSKLVTAAVVSREFCNLLLSSPAAALIAGYYGESFYMTPEEQEVVISIRASSLTDFAIQLTGNRRNGQSRTFIAKTQGPKEHTMKLCPHCQSYLDRYGGKYRCSRCHIWLEESDYAETESERLAIAEATSIDEAREMQSDSSIENCSSAPIP
jgi:hypothetical protein